MKRASGGFDGGDNAHSSVDPAAFTSRSHGAAVRPDPPLSERAAHLIALDLDSPQPLIAYGNQASCRCARRPGQKGMVEFMRCLQGSLCLRYDPANDEPKRPFFVLSYRKLVAS